MPLFTVSIPSNGLYFFSLIIDIANFKLIPPIGGEDGDGDIDRKSLLNLASENFIDSAFNDNFNKMGYQSHYSIKNN
jgi:hypothetical protein